MYSTLVFLVLLLLKLDTSTFGILFEYRLRCPDTPEKWRENTNSYICHNNTVYHCMQDQDGRYVVFCAPSIWIQPDYCPEFNAKASLIDVILCQGATEGCPESIYLSNTVYQYPSCFRTVKISTITSPPSVDGTITTATNPGDTGQPKQDSEEGKRVWTDILWIIFGIILSILVLLAIIFSLKLREQKRKEREKKIDGKDSPTHSNNRESDDHDSETESLLRGSITDNSEREPECKATFVRPRSYENAVKTLKRDKFIIILGVPGSGKTTLANVIVKEEFKDYCVHYMKPKQTALPDLTSDKDEVVVWDDCFGIWNVCHVEENMNASVRNTISGLFKICKSKTKYAIVCFDSFSDEAGIFDQLGKNVINLADSYESQPDKEKLCELSDRKIFVNKVSKEVGFPLLIRLILGHHCPIEKAQEFLEKPIQFLQDNLNNLFENERDMYITLLYVLCNSPSVNLKDINWDDWTKLKEDCRKGKNDENDSSHHQKSKLDSQMREENLFSVILRNPKGIEMNKILAQYLVETESPGVYSFLHQFLAERLLCYHVERVGNEVLLKVCNAEVKSVVKALKSPPSNLSPVQSSTL